MGLIFVARQYFDIRPLHQRDTLPPMPLDRMILIVSPRLAVDVNPDTVWGIQPTRVEKTGCASYRKAPW